MFPDCSPRSGTALRPTALLGVEGLDQLTHGIFWSLLVNVGAYVLASIWSQQDVEERSQAAAFVGIKEPGPAPIPALLSVPEIERLIHLYVPPEEADRIRAELLGGEQPGQLDLPELLEMRIRLERALAASLGLPGVFSSPVPSFTALSNMSSAFSAPRRPSSRYSSNSPL